MAAQQRNLLVTATCVVRNDQSPRKPLTFGPHWLGVPKQIGTVLSDLLPYQPQPELIREMPERGVHYEQEIESDLGRFRAARSGGLRQCRWSGVLRRLLRRLL